MLLYHVTQTVEVGDQRVETERGSLTIRWGKESRAGDIEMNLHPDVQPEGFTGVALGDRIRVVLEEDGGETLTIRGDVTHVARVRQGDVSVWRVSGRTEEGIARDYAVLAEWTEVSASEIVADAWARSGEESIDLAGVEPGAPVVERYSSPYNSLYEILEDMAVRVGWAWRIREGVLYWFDPLAEAGPDLDQSALHIEADTLEVSQDLENVRNIVRTQAFDHRNFARSRLVRPGECLREIPRPSVLRSDEWELREDPVVFLSGGQSGIVAVSEDGEAYRLQEPVGVPEDGAPVEAYLNLPVRRPVWMRRQSDASITLYGPRAGVPQLGAGDMEIDEAQQALDAYLTQHAFPSVTAQTGVTRLLWQPDTVVRAWLTDPPVDRDMYVTDIRIVSDDADIACEISLATPEDVLARAGRGDPARETFRRLERLERANWTLGARGGSTASRIGDLRGRARITGAWAWRGEVEGVPAATIEGRWGWRGEVEPVPVATIEGRWGWRGFVVLAKPRVTMGRAYTVDEV